jgi:hypothetical protein
MIAKCHQHNRACRHRDEQHHQDSCYSRRIRHISLPVKKPKNKATGTIAVSYTLIHRHPHTHSYKFFNANSINYSK